MRAYSVFSLAILAATLSSMGAYAQSLPGGVTFSGELALESLRFDGDGDDATTLVYGDLDMNFAPGTISGGLGFSLGFLAADTNDFSENAFFGGVSYDTGSGVITVGAPRGSAKSFSRMPDMGGIHLFSLELRPAYQGAVDLFALISDDQHYGLRYDGTFDNVQFGASWHRFESEVDVVDLGASYETDTWFASGSAEFVSADDEDAHVLHLEGGLQSDAWEAGVGLTAGDDFVGDLAMGWFTYSALPNTDVTATVMTGDDFTAWGLEAEWRFLNHSFLRGGLVDGDNSDTTMAASVGLQF